MSVKICSHFFVAKNVATKKWLQKSQAFSAKIPGSGKGYFLTAQTSEAFPSTGLKINWLKLFPAVYPEIAAAIKFLPRLVSMKAH